MHLANKVKTLAEHRIQYLMLLYNTGTIAQHKAHTYTSHATAFYVALHVTAKTVPVQRVRLICRRRSAAASILVLS